MESQIKSDGLTGFKPYQQGDKMMVRDTETGDVYTTMMAAWIGFRIREKEAREVKEREDKEKKEKAAKAAEERE